MRKNMEKKMKRLFHATATVALLSFAAVMGVPASAADIPCSTARLIVPWNAGGDTDIIFRLVVNSINMSDFKPKLQVVNVSGRSGNKGAKEVKNSRPDGCTLLAIHESQITTYLAGRVDFTWDAFDPVARLTYTPSILGGSAKVPFKSMKDFIDSAKKKPNSVRVGVTTGSTSQYLNLLIEDATGTKFKYIPYEGTRERLTAILAHNVDVGEMSILTAKKYLKEGTMKAFAIAAEKRDPIMPELPTFREQGIDIVYGLYRGVVAPQGTSKDIIRKYDAAFAKALRDLAVKKALDEKGTWIVYLNSEDYRKFFEQEFAAHKKTSIKIGLYKE
jgi:tripartite-type tricarboxylate transporter receptor subunit TctC